MSKWKMWIWCQQETPEDNEHALVLPLKTPLMDKRRTNWDIAQIVERVWLAQITTKLITVVRKVCTAAHQLHQSIQTKGKAYHFSQCGKCCSSIGEKLFRCLHCGKSFGQKGNLQMHHCIHTREKPYRCSQCGKNFTYQSHLKDHERIHMGEKLYPCPERGKRFNKRNTLSVVIISKSTSEFTQERWCITVFKYTSAPT